MGKKKRAAISQVDSASGSAPFHNPFAALGNLEVPAGEPAPAPPPEPTAASPASRADDLGDQPRLVLRRERKGRGGKTVTLLEGLQLDPEALDSLARALAKALGGGARAEGPVVVLAGDQRDRAQTWLRKRGAREVVLGN